MIRAVEGISKFLCSCLLLFQGLLLDAYLSIVHNNNAWWCWIIADVAILIVWFIFLIHAKRHFKRKHADEHASGEAPHEIKYAFAFWFFYMTFLTPRIGIIFHEKASTLEEEEILGPNFLKIAVSCTPLVYFLLVHGSHSNQNRINGHLSVAAIAFSGAIDLFDAIDLIEFLIEPPEGAPYGYMTASLVFCCVSFFLPTLSLFALRRRMKPGRVSSMTFAISYEFLNMLIINIPFLVIRSILWHDYHAPVSVLLMKNILGIMVSVYEIIEYFGEFKPKRCEKCNDWFESGEHRAHQNNCRGNLQEEEIALSQIDTEGQCGSGSGAVADTSFSDTGGNAKEDPDDKNGATAVGDAIGDANLDDTPGDVATNEADGEKSDGAEPKVVVV